jgi:hypothetical protein
MTDVVGDDDEIFLSIEQLAFAKQNSGKPDPPVP